MQRSYYLLSSASYDGTSDEQCRTSEGKRLGQNWNRSHALFGIRRPVITIEPAPKHTNPCHSRAPRTSRVLHHDKVVENLSPEVEKFYKLDFSLTNLQQKPISIKSFFPSLNEKLVFLRLNRTSLCPYLALSLSFSFPFSFSFSFSLSLSTKTGKVENLFCTRLWK